MRADVGVQTRRVYFEGVDSRGQSLLSSFCFPGFAVVPGGLRRNTAGHQTLLLRPEGRMCPGRESWPDGQGLDQVPALRVPLQFHHHFRIFPEGGLSLES